MASSQLRCPHAHAHNHNQNHCRHCPLRRHCHHCPLHNHNPHHFANLPQQPIITSNIPPPQVSQELDHTELDVEEKDDEPIFVLTDEWRELFVKSETKRKLEKKQGKKGKK